MLAVSQEVGEGKKDRGTWGCSEALESISALLADAACLGATEARGARDGCQPKHRKCK